MSTAKPPANSAVAEIARHLSNEYGFTREQAVEIVTETFNVMKDILLEKGKLGIGNWGNYRIRRRSKMQYYDFHTKKVQVVDRNAVIFYPATHLKELVNEVMLDDAGVPQPKARGKRA